MSSLCLTLIKSSWLNSGLELALLTLMLKEGKVYVPKDEVLRVEIIRLHHDMPIGGHGGQ